MPLHQTLMFFGTGYIYGYYTKPNSLILPFVGTAGLLYSGAMIEAEKLSTSQNITTRCKGFWVIGAGVACAGIGTNVLLRKVLNGRGNRKLMEWI